MEVNKMKKTLKVSALLMIVAIMLVSLTGCFKNKIVATKHTDAENSMVGAYDEKIEITFKKDKADKMVWTMEFEDEETAEKMSSLYDGLVKNADIDQKGKKVVVTFKTEDIAKQNDMKEEDLTKEKLIEKLEEDGYTVKK